MRPHKIVGRPEHQAYVLSVGAALVGQGVELISVLVSTAAEVRHADIELAVAGRAGRVLLRWDELNGWTWQTRERGEPPGPVCYGGSVLPAPPDVAEWVVTSVHQPVRTAPRAPYAIPDLNARLRAYTRLGTRRPAPVSAAEAGAPCSGRHVRSSAGCRD